MQKANHIKLKPTAKPLSNSTERKSTPTEQIASKMTSPTLVDFRNKNSQVPEWRLQLQNAVQQRLKSEKTKADGPSVATQPTAEASAPVVAAPASEPASGNPYLSNALKRIESSRNRYYVPESPPKKKPQIEEEPKKDFPFKIAARTEVPDKADKPEAAAQESAKPKLVKRKKSLPIKDLYDTSELDPQFPPARLSSSFGAAPAKEDPKPAPVSKATEPEPEKEAKPGVEARKQEVEEVPAAEVTETAVAEAVSETSPVIDDYDDYASFGLRFNAGVFDFLIGSFLSFVLLLPFIVAGGDWFTFNGAVAFIATCSIVMFIYLTASVGLAGKSFGMHIFSLEMIDSGGENYPSFHQSAVSAAVYLVSTACLGIGFVTALFDDDRRAAHDLVSGTLVVREL